MVQRNVESPFILALCVGTEYLDISISTYEGYLVDQESVPLAEVSNNLLSSLSSCPSHIIYLRALDIALENLHTRQRAAFSKVCAISGSTEFDTFLWTEREIKNLQNLDPKYGLTNLIGSNPDSIWNGVLNIKPSGSSQDSHSKTKPSNFGEGIDAPFYSADSLRRFFGKDRDALQQISSISFLPSFMASIFCGNVAPIDQDVAKMTDLWDFQDDVWSNKMLDFIAETHQIVPESSINYALENRQRRDTLLGMFGQVHRQSYEQPIGKISRYFVERYKFHPDCLVASFTGNLTEIYKSCCLDPADALVAFDADSANVTMMNITCPQMPPNFGFPCGGIAHGAFDASYSISQSSSPSGTSPSVVSHEAPNYKNNINKNNNEQLDSTTTTAKKATPSSTNTTTNTILFSKREASKFRILVKDLFCNASWETFDQLVAQTPQGGTHKTDDKMYVLMGTDDSASGKQAMFRFEKGHRVDELSDRRAVARCVLDSQFLSIRAQICRVYKDLSNAGFFGTKSNTRKLNPRLEFNSFNQDALPKRIIAVGPTAQRDVITQVLSNVLGAPVYRPINQNGLDVSSIIPIKAASGRAIYCASVVLNLPLPNIDIIPKYNKVIASSESKENSPAVNGNGSLNYSKFDLTRVAEPDMDECLQYGAMLEEFVRIDKISRMD